MIKLSKKIASFDLDGTLAESKQHLEKDMSEMLCSLLKEKMVAVISGGSYNQFTKQFLPFLTPSKEDEDIIYKNLILLPTSGSRRYQYDSLKKEWVITDEEAMDEEVREKVKKVLGEIISSGKYGLVPVVEGDEIVEDRVTQITMSALGQHAPLDLKKAWDPDQVKRQQIKKELEPLLPEVSITIGGATSIDILPKGFNKASGLLRLLNKLGMTIQDMVFVGDAIFPGGNDYSAYEAGIESIKVSGPTEVKELIKNWIG
ncbi:MAG TPA: HAD-IIB family hydrolase [Candidatus Paceibacterota bacterium]|nr:HAD-IIB family hydrolase [Candidatus Paceibacterota bacterium]